MSYTDVSLCSKALLKIGAQTITSFEDGTAESEVSANLYPLVRDSLLSSYPWSFAIAQKRLGRLDLTPVADFKYAFQLPSDFLRIISAGSGSKGRGADKLVPSPDERNILDRGHGQHSRCGDCPHNGRSGCDILDVGECSAGTVHKVF